MAVKIKNYQAFCETLQNDYGLEPEDIQNLEKKYVVKPKDPNAPKRLTAFTHWYNQEKDEMQQETGLEGKKLLDHARDQWKEMDDEEKEEHKGLAQQHNVDNGLVKPKKERKTPMNGYQRFVQVNGIGNKQAGDWKTMTPAEKKPYDEYAEQFNQEHGLVKKTPTKKNAEKPEKNKEKNKNKEKKTKKNK